MTGDERLRLFCGLRFPPDVLGGLAAWQLAHLGEGRIVPPENLHVTLAFLGSRPAEQVGVVGEALRAAAAVAEGLVLRIRGYRETRTVGMLVFDDDEGHATALAERLQERLEAAGVYRRETRDWLPHLTVLRFRERPRLRPPLPEIGGMSPSDAAVFISRLGPGGARYEVLETVSLGGR